MFTAASFTVAQRWRQPECPSVDRWRDQMWHTDTTEYYLARILFGMKYQYLLQYE